MKETHHPLPEDVGVPVKHRGGDQHWLGLGPGSSNPRDLHISLYRYSLMGKGHPISTGVFQGHEGND